MFVFYLFGLQDINRVYAETHNVTNAVSTDPRVRKAFEANHAISVHAAIGKLIQPSPDNPWSIVPAADIQEPVRQEPVNNREMVQEPVNREPVREEPGNREPVREEPVNPEPVREDTVNRVREDTVNRVREDTVNRVREEPVQEPLRQETMFRWIGIGIIVIFTFISAYYRGLVDKADDWQDL